LTEVSVLFDILHVGTSNTVSLQIKVLLSSPVEIYVLQFFCDKLQ